VELGYSSFSQYCDRELGLAHSTAYEYLRAGMALAGLPQLRAFFKDGELSWHQVRNIVLVAKPQTEAAWIQLAVEAPVRELIAEVREAKRTGRSAPRDRRHGLPNLLVRLSVDLTLEEKERVRAAFALVREALDDGPGPEDEGPGLPGAAGDRRPELVRWADGVLSGAIPIAPVVAHATAGDAGPDSDSGSAPAKARPPRPRPAQTILYHSCPECRQATVETQDGLVRVEGERVAELEPQSNHLTIAPEEEVIAEVLPDGQTDDPNSQGLALKVIHRDGLVCQNPGCDNRHRLHAHHIVYRSEGGRTVLSNEVTVCDRCHALIHAGLLEVVGRPGEQLTFTPCPAAPGVKVRDTEALRQRLGELAAQLPPPPPVPTPPVVPAPYHPESAAADSERKWEPAPATTRITTASGESADVDSETLVMNLAEGLVRLGTSRKEAVALVRSSLEILAKAGNAAPTEEEILRGALQVE